jgi:hypothetical protein
VRMTNQGDEHRMVDQSPTFSKACVTFRIRAPMHALCIKTVPGPFRSQSELTWFHVTNYADLRFFLWFLTQFSMPTRFEFWTIRILFGWECYGSWYKFKTRSEVSKLLIRLIGHMRIRLSSSKK